MWVIAGESLCRTMPVSSYNNKCTIVLHMLYLLATVVDSDNPCTSSSTTAPIITVCDSQVTPFTHTIYVYTKRVPLGEAECNCNILTNAAELGIQRPTATMKYVQPEIAQHLSFVLDHGIEIPNEHVTSTKVSLFSSGTTALDYKSTAQHVSIQERACLEIRADPASFMLKVRCKTYRGPYIPPNFSRPPPTTSTSPPPTTSTAPSTHVSTTPSTHVTRTTNQTTEHTATSAVTAAPYDDLRMYELCGVIIYICVIGVVVFNANRRLRNRGVQQTNSDPPIHQTHSLFSIHQSRSASSHKPTLHADSLGDAYSPRPTRSLSIHQERRPTLHHIRRPTLHEIAKHIPTTDTAPSTGGTSDNNQ